MGRRDGGEKGGGGRRTGGEAARGGHVRAGAGGVVRGVACEVLEAESRLGSGIPLTQNSHQSGHRELSILRRPHPPTPT